MSERPATPENNHTHGAPRSSDIDNETFQLYSETLDKMTALLGDRRHAEEWMTRPAMGLDRQRPVDLLGTRAGSQVLGDFITRLEFGVYT